jgi:hypothetical protein
MAGLAVSMSLKFLSVLFSGSRPPGSTNHPDKQVPISSNLYLRPISVLMANIAVAA